MGTTVGRTRRWARSVIGALGTALVLLAASPSEVHAQSDGTHFIVEATVGASMPLGIDADRVGYSMGAIGGFGGKLPGSPMRLYAIGEFAYSSFAIRRTTGEALGRDLTELGGGGRMLFPLTARVRLYADVLLGLAWLAAEEPGVDSERVVWIDEEPRLMALTALGLQFRPAMSLSIGFKADFGLLLDDADLPAEDLSGRLNLLGTATFHF